MLLLRPSYSDAQRAATAVATPAAENTRRVIELRPGGCLELEFPGGGRVRGRVRAIEPGRVLELDWRYGEEEPSVVRFELTEDGEETVLVLEHSRIEEPLGMVYIARWTGMLERFGEGLAR